MLTRSGYDGTNVSPAIVPAIENRKILIRAKYAKNCLETLAPIFSP